MAEWVIDRHDDGSCDIMRDRRIVGYGLEDLDAAERQILSDSRSTYENGDSVVVRDTKDGSRTPLRHRRRRR